VRGELELGEHAIGVVAERIHRQVAAYLADQEHNPDVTIISFYFAPRRPKPCNTFRSRGLRPSRPDSSGESGEPMGSHPDSYANAAQTLSITPLRFASPTPRRTSWPPAVQQPAAMSGTRE
jgi:hypothetical protein